MLLAGCRPFRREDAELYVSRRWWSGLTCSDLLDKASDIYPERPAIVDSQGRLTYAQLRETADRLAIALLDLGIRPLDRVLLQLPNWHEFAYIYFALQKIGAIPVLLIARYRQHEADHLCRIVQASAWIAPEMWDKIDYRPIIADVLEKNRQVRNVIMVRATESCRYHRLEDLIAPVNRTGVNVRRLEAFRPDASQVAHMGPTGGSTGMPKVAPRTHNELLCSVEYAAAAWEMTLHDKTLLATPIGHDLTFTKGFLMAVGTYGQAVMLDSTDPARVCAAIQKEKVTAVVWVPTMAARLLDFDGLKEFDLSSLKKMHCGGGKSEPELIKAVTEKLNCVYFNAYGGTEGMTTMSRAHYDLDRASRTVGRPTCPYDTYKIIDVDGNEVGPNAKGELVIKGPGVFSGYYNNPEENKTAFTADGCFRVGDLAMIDEEGDIILCGRLKDIINRGGESISAPEIESLISRHPDVVLVAVIGMPDHVMGERVCAYIQPKAGAKLDFAGIVAHLKSCGASVLYLPERIEFVDKMPLTQSEKVDKRRLQEDIANKLLAQAAHNGSV
jgi:non-ribosomal peptide synthetase component E (peptide arylation enzyme)